MGLVRYRIKGDDWDYFKEIHFFFESFYFYADEINQFIDKEISSAKDIYQKFSKEIEVDPTWEDEWFDYFANVQAKVGLTDIYYDSLIMTLYSFVERKMFFLSNHLAQEQTIKVNDIAGKGIFKYQKYLSKVCGIDFTQIDNEWANIVGYNRLRNQIVHSEGIRNIPKSNHDLVKFLKSIDGVVLNEEGDTISYHFSTDNILKTFAATARTIIDHIYSEQV
jgi:hypothetical protein